MMDDAIVVLPLPVGLTMTIFLRLARISARTESSARSW
jgi:hypothetical protein